MSKKCIVKTLRLKKFEWNLNTDWQYKKGVHIYNRNTLAYSFAPV
jgi:hypothetical protein